MIQLMNHSACALYARVVLKWPSLLRRQGVKLSQQGAQQKTKVEMIGSVSCRPTHRCFASFPSLQRSSVLENTIPRHGQAMFGGSPTRYPAHSSKHYQNLSVAGLFCSRKDHQVQFVRALQHKPDSSSSSNMKTSEEWQQSNARSWYILAALVLTGGVAYAYFKQRSDTESPEMAFASNLSESSCETESESDKEKRRRGVKTDGGWRKVAKALNSLTLEEAVEQAADLCHRVKDESGSPGLIVAVSIDGQPVWTQGFGYADVENRLPCKTDTVIRIASISKSITMTAVAKAMENGDLDLDKPVQVYVPQFPEKTFKGEKVTITTRQLASHLSGIRHYFKDYIKTNNSDNKKDNSDNKKDNSDNKKDNSDSKNNNSDKKTDNSDNKKEKKNKSGDKVDHSDKKDNSSTAASSSLPSPRSSQWEVKRKAATMSSGEFDQKEYYIKEKFKTTNEGLALFKDDPLVYEPDTKFLYSTHAWTLVAAVLEGATKTKFPVLVRRLFRDLGMEHTYLDENEPLIYNRARNYIRNQKGILVNAPYVDCSYKYAGGGILSTMSDLLRFAHVMLYSYQYRENNNNNTGQDKDNNFNSTKTQISNRGQTPSSTESPKPLSPGQTPSSTESPKPLSPGQTPLSPGYLRAGTVQQLWTPVSLARAVDGEDVSYGLGWAVRPQGPHYGGNSVNPLYVMHTGAAVGASSVLLILPRGDDSCDGEDKGDNSCPPRGVCVAMAVNLVKVRLRPTALQIARLFERVKDE